MKKFIGLILLALLVAFIASTFVAWPVMILLGNLHALGAAVPALGFWSCLSITVPATMVITGVRAYVSNEEK